MTSAWRRNVNTLIISTRTPLTKCDDWRPSNISIHTFLARCDHQKTVPWSYECFYTLHSYEGRLVNWEAKNIEKFLYIPLVWGETAFCRLKFWLIGFYTLPSYEGRPALAVLSIGMQISIHSPSYEGKHVGSCSGRDYVISIHVSIHFPSYEGETVHRLCYAL